MITVKILKIWTPVIILKFEQGGFNMHSKDADIRQTV